MIKTLEKQALVEKIIEAIKIARKKGLKIPIIYNSNGYENVETIKLLDGYIDVYLPDLKYYSDNIFIFLIISKKLSFRAILVTRLALVNPKDITFEIYIVNNIYRGIRHVSV